MTAGEGHTGHLIGELLLSNEEFSKKVKQLTVLTSNPDHEHIQALVELGAKAVKATTAKEIEAAMVDAKPNAAMLIPPATGDKMKEVTQILAVMKAAGGVENAVMLGSAGADLADANSMPRLREFVEMEKLAMQELGIVSIIRAGFYAENLLLYNHSAQDKGKLPIPTGKTHRFAPIALGDVALVAAHLLTSKTDRGELITLTGPKMLSADELATVASQGLGAKMEHQDITEEEAKKLLNGQVDPAEMEYLLEYYALVRAGHANYIATRGFQEITGQPPMDMDAFFKTYSEDFTPKKRRTRK